MVKPHIFKIDDFTVLNELRLGSNSEINGFTLLRTGLKSSILKIDAFTKLKMEKVKKNCQDRKNHLKN